MLWASHDQRRLLHKHLRVLVESTLTISQRLGTWQVPGMPAEYTQPAGGLVALRWILFPICPWRTKVGKALAYQLSDLKEAFSILENDLHYDQSIHA